jgi:phospholipase A2
MGLLEFNNISSDPKHKPPPLGTCEIWIGSFKSDDPDHSRLDELDEESLLKRDRVGVVYMSLIPNESNVPGFDPSGISTWRRDVAAEESQQWLEVAEANLVESREIEGSREGREGA